jgi:3-hydroxyisobutyrate dehydrogenase-like beta-hydroxyacid dehydrogenase
MNVITCLEGRSARTRTLAEQAGIVNVGTYEALVEQADMVLSIMVPSYAQPAAELVAEALKSTGADLIYADCNAIAPQTTLAIGKWITDAGGKFVDASIIGGPPREGYTPRFYASGPAADQFAALNNYGLDVIVMGTEIGQASAIKMCYAALTKGTSALMLELLAAAQALGVYDALMDELANSQAANKQQMERGLPGVPPKARRWVGEMEEIAATFESVGLTPNILTGAADVYRLLGETPLADLTPEDKIKPALAEVIAAMVEQAKQRMS